MVSSQSQSKVFSLTSKPTAGVGLSRGQRKRQAVKSRLESRRQLGELAGGLKEAKKKRDDEAAKVAANRNKPLHSFASDMAGAVDAIEGKDDTSRDTSTQNAKASKQLTPEKMQKLRNGEIERFNAISALKPFINDPTGVMALHLDNTVGSGRRVVKGRALGHRKQRDLLALDTHVKLQRNISSEAAGKVDSEVRSKGVSLRSKAINKHGTRRTGSKAKLARANCKAGNPTVMST